MYKNSDGEHITPTFKLADKTVIHDLDENNNVMWIEGQLVLPPGSVIQLMEPPIDATVIRTRLLPGNDETPTMLCIDVEVPKQWWEKGEQQTKLQEQATNDLSTAPSVIFQDTEGNTIGYFQTDGSPMIEGEPPTGAGPNTKVYIGVDPSRV